MKKRIIITIAIVVLILLYQNLQPKPEEFTGEDLLVVRGSDALEYVESDDDGILVFWNNGAEEDRGEDFYSLAADYYKAGFNKWNLINGGMHSGDYDTGITYQYLPKQAFKKFAIIYGVIVDDEIDSIKLESKSGSNYTVNIVKSSTKMIWFLKLPEDIGVGKITCYNSMEEIVYVLDIDNEWLIN